MSKGRKYLLLVGLWCAMSAWALHVEPVGVPDKDYTFVDNGGDTIYIFAADIAMRHKNGTTDWYDVNDQLYASNIDEIYPDDGGYYTLQNGKKEYFYVFSYDNYKADVSGWELVVTPTCDATVLTLNGTLPQPMAYTLPDGRTRTLIRHCTVSYTDLAWGKTEWKDSAAVMSFEFPQSRFTLPALYKATDISLAVDDIAQALGMMPDSVIVTVDAPIAVKSHITSRTEIREGKNEFERPDNGEVTDEETISGHSAEMRVSFYSNPTPAALFFSWRVYKESSLLHIRNDENLLEVFSEPGMYRVVNTVSGTQCPCETCTPDSTEVTVNVHESYINVPNVFTPNGDGMNDVFLVEYRSIVEFHCWVYNRWGRLVYEWTDPAKGWDGTINGRPAAEGAYFYVIRARGSDANPKQGYKTKAAYRRAKNNSDESIMGIYQMSGDINLLRGK